MVLQQQYPQKDSYKQRGRGRRRRKSREKAAMTGSRGGWGTLWNTVQKEIDNARLRLTCRKQIDRKTRIREKEEKKKNQSIVKLPTATTANVTQYKIHLISSPAFVCSLINPPHPLFLFSGSPFGFISTLYLFTSSRPRPPPSPIPPPDRYQGFRDLSQTSNAEGSP